MSIVISSESYDEGITCCGVHPLIEKIDTGREWQARYEYRARCPKCGASTTQCTWKPDAKTIWNSPRDRVKVT